MAVTSCGCLHYKIPGRLVPRKPNLVGRLKRDEHVLNAASSLLNKKRGSDLRQTDPLYNPRSVAVFTSIRFLTAAMSGRIRYHSVLVSGLRPGLSSDLFKPKRWS